ncbi:MAG TPA: methionyl-tRNA formyltransferase, partial [Gemmiger qucibialis]|nr:methionyl-tRNA formyltransferase [Gemmiger qucibialis]
ENPANAAPGSVLAVKPLTIACQDGSIVLDSVTPEGGKSMAGTAWAAGRRLKAGDSL